MKGDKVIYNGRLIPSGEFDYKTLAGQCHIYQRIHTRDHIPFHGAAHLDIAARTMEGMHGCGIGIDEKELVEEIKQLLSANRYGSMACEVMLRVFSPDLPAPFTSSAPSVPPTYPISATPTAPPVFPAAKGGAAQHLLEVASQLLYPRYVLWHSRVEAVLFPCEYLFMGYPTSVSLVISDYARRYAAANGAREAIIQNREGVLTNVGDESLFITTGGEVLRSPCSEGAADSVMGRLIEAACGKLGITLTETPLNSVMLGECDEAFFPTTQGITPIKGFGQRLFTNITAGRIAEALNEVTL